MKILIVTQKVDINDPILGFFHQWIIEFAKNSEKIFVICLYEGQHDLPNNVEVYSLGKETNSSRLGYIIRFYKLLWKLCGEYDSVFVHMNQAYILLGGIFWRLLGVTTGLWYVHRAKTLSLWVAEKLVNVVFTATHESFMIKSTKLHFVGQAVDIEKFRRPAGRNPGDKPFRIVSVGRLTPIKNLDTLIRATKILKDRGYDMRVELIGAAVTEGDIEYEKMLHELASALDVQEKIIFVGSVPNHEVAQHYWGNHVSLNLCPTGGMDKAILESMAAGTPAIISNEAFRNYFGQYANELIFKLRDEVDCANKIEAYIKSENKEALVNFLLKRVEEKSTLSSLVKQIIQILTKARNE